MYIFHLEIHVQRALGFIISIIAASAAEATERYNQTFLFIGASDFDDYFKKLLKLKLTDENPLIFYYF